jgi:hypothetical protein
MTKRACALFLFLAACGGGDGEEGEPMLAGSLSGEYDGYDFEAGFGFATPYQGSGLIAVGDGPLRCGTENDNEPPAGTNVAIRLEALEVGSYSSVFVEIFHNEGQFEGTGSNQGSVTITSVSEDSIAGTVEYSYDDDEGRHFAVSGSFDVVHCAP